MKTRFAWLALALALGGCGSTPRWDASVFPEQVVYDTQVVPTKADAQK